ncbi:MAG: ZIP family metal transporter [Patescibacteria group bacterium]|jgi:zinc and cadmium transporter
MPILGYIVSAVLVVSLISLIGVVFFWVNQKFVTKIVPWLVAFAAGTLLAAAWFDLIPESLVGLGESAFIWVVAGILLFLLFEQVLHWHHEHGHDCDECGSRPKAVGYSVLLGDGLHNFLDGVLIASAFMASVPVGIATTMAVMFHEIPQELGDFGVLLHSGFSRTKALYFNFISALAAVAGGLVAYFALNSVQNSIPYIVAIGAGGFLYIALTDLFAELKGGKNIMLRLGQMLVLIFGMLLIYYLV